jgi:hypothetical protein
MVMTPLFGLTGLLSSLSIRQKVSLVAFYLEGEAKQWWQWLKNVYLEDGQPVTWEIFEKEILVRFGPTEYEDYDEAL